MNPIEVSFGTDPWWIVTIKVVVMFVFLLVFTIFNVWFERRVVGKMQQRKGPIMNGPLGLAQALADGTKLLLKEDFRPTGADKVVFTLAPILTGTAAFTAWSVMPLGGEVSIFGVRTHLQLTDLPMGVLFILSVAAVGIYGIVLAGWASTSEYSKVGSIRSTAQMISYEIAMGLSLVAVFMYAGSMSTSDIVNKQMETWGLLTPLQFPSWYAILLFPSFFIYVISMVAETNRAPFDLVECEQELVSGYITDYSGFRYAIYFLAEYINMATVSGVATTLFLGGYHAPWPIAPWLSVHAGWEWIDSGWMGPVWFLIKNLCFIFFFVWLRGTLPRFRYDQFMHLGWKVLMPINLVWILAVATIRIGGERGWLSSSAVLVVVAVAVVALGVILLLPSKKEEVRSEVSRSPLLDEGVFDPFKDGYPVPPMPGQILPEYADVLVGPDGELIGASRQKDHSPMSDQDKEVEHGVA
ncbi:MAG: NADH-quinone oxidoreductase subunit NuoH [Propionibacteriaceae bacterium]|jgi:NADH-quinone oxidoreductase subunit H|nr:NADH-quinone oxidoreductase subunit NuoH [Propionibacteriaceae bacterium]